MKITNLVQSGFDMLNTKWMVLMIAVFIMVLPIPSIAGTIEVVATGFIPYHDMVLDPNGKAHITYQDTKINELYYLNNVSGNWQSPEYIYYTSIFGSSAVSMDLDLSGNVHIVFDSGIQGNDNFTYAENISGSWSIEPVRPRSRWYSIAMDSADQPHVAYYYDYDGLNYAVKSAGSWNHENVDSNGEIGTYAGRYSDIALDSADKTHIIYYDFTTGSLRYATNDTGVWSIETVSTNMTYSGAITLDPSNYPHIAYEKEGNIYYKYKTVSGWVEELITTGGIYGVSTGGIIDIELDASGVPYILCAENRESLILAEKTSGTWEYHYLYSAARNFVLWGGVLKLYGDTAHVTVSDVDTEQLLYLVGYEDKDYTITATAGFGGSISPEGEVIVDYGADQSFTITPWRGFWILDVLVDGVSIGAVSTYTFSNVTSDYTIHATFSRMGMRRR